MPRAARNSLPAEGRARSSAPAPGACDVSRTTKAGIGGQPEREEGCAHSDAIACSRAS
eukprot:CAMPEP_0176293930 /NCGR_PEP_ID=MMETSP0121_2-20121125/56870_1 /TAXON_ID=160619 /ORGANISM="Kryptoperidinium foliaceum, Strain CCMP 1326" /LENGTH=57 /DNA_ID=CAMNT_0017634923 /DNA_START=103 /DNA_END=273 /DNA_ORIENTATION=+